VLPILIAIEQYNWIVFKTVFSCEILMSSLKIKMTLIVTLCIGGLIFGLIIYKMILYYIINKATYIYYCYCAEYIRFVSEHYYLYTICSAHN